MFKTDKQLAAKKSRVRRQRRRPPARAAPASAAGAPQAPNSAELPLASSEAPRKAPSSGVSEMLVSAATVTLGNPGVEISAADRARLQREQRRKRAAETSGARQLQRLLRGQSARRRAADGLREAWNRKIQDLITAMRIMQQKKQPFLLPPQVLRRPLSELLFFYKVETCPSDATRLDFITDHLAKNFSRRDQNNNLLCAAFAPAAGGTKVATGDEHVQDRMRLIFLLRRYMKHVVSETFTAAWVTKQQSAGSHSRRGLFSQLITGASPLRCDPAVARAISASQLWCASELFTPKVLIGRICSTCSRLQAPGFQSSASDRSAWEAKTRESMKTLLIPLIPQLVRSEVTDAHRAAFIDATMTTAGALDTMPEPLVRLLCFEASDWEFLLQLVKRRLQSMPTEVLRQEQAGVTPALAVMANLICLAERRQTFQAPCSPALEESYLSLLAELMMHVPEMTFSTQASTWRREGAKQTAVAIPYVVVRRVHRITEVGWIKRTCGKVLQPRFPSYDSEPPPDLVRRNRSFWGSVSSWGKKIFGGSAARQLEVSAASPVDVGERKQSSGTSGRSRGGLFSRLFGRRSSGLAVAKAEDTVAASHVDGPVAATAAAVGPIADPDDPQGGELFSRGGVLALSSILARLFWLWPLTNQQTPSFSCLSHLAYSTKFLPHLFAFLEASEDLQNFAEQTNAGDLAQNEGTGMLAALSLVALVFNHSLTVLDNIELYEEQRPFSRAGVVRMICCFRSLLFRLIWEIPDVRPISEGASKMSARGTRRKQFCEFSKGALIVVMRALYNRSSRKPLCSPETWHVPALRSNLGTGNRFVELILHGQRSADLHSPPSFSELGTAASKSHLEKLRTNNSIKAYKIICFMPYAVPFRDRMLLFQRIMAQNRDEYQHGGDVNAAVKVRIRRQTVFDDSFIKLNRLGKDLRRRIYVMFVNDFGQEETGTDAGGLFKELWTTLSGVAFDINYGLWSTTPENLMYPSPSASVIHSNHLELYAFLGRILGKAILEGIVVQPNFAHFFLTKLLGRSSSLSDLASLDEELYRNLMFLKTYDGDAEDLGLNFTIAENHLGTQRVHDLRPNGEHIDVTSQNKLDYIYLMANYRLNLQIKKQCEAFLEGLRELVPVTWLRMFSEGELQWLVSGSADALDISDWSSHTHYAGGYSSISSGIRKFWNVVKTLSAQERAQLLKFATSCERAPPLGFVAMNPPFTIQYVGDSNKLPSASTCFNKLKLPSYKSERILREKLLMAIQSGAGFDLS